MANQQAQAVGTVTYGMGIQQAAPNSSFSSYADSPGFVPFSNPYGFAEGGSLIAKRPTAAIFGESGAEMATFTPLGKKGTDINKVFGDTSGIGGNGASLDLRIAISEGLIAEIVNSSLEGMAAHIEHTRRTT